MIQEHRSALLASSSSGGTIAAVRCLAKHGINAQVASSTKLGAAAWSRHAKRNHTVPPEIDSEPFLDRLLAIGRADPGLVLLPTSDETAWLYTANAAVLGQYFRMYQPSIETIRSILDKKRLTEAAIQAGLDVLATWDLDHGHDLATIAATLPYPILIKPRTHVQRVRNDKGVVVDTPAELVKQYENFVLREQYHSPSTIRHHNSQPPILQQFAVDGCQNVQSITGFIDRSGEQFVTRRSVKVFQRSQPVGIGVCHEALSASSTLTQAVYDLCRKLQYFGVFEVEFIRFGDRWTLIDFNPRFYNQMGLDIRRGMPLPMLAYLDASGQRTALRAAVANARIDDNLPAVFCDRFTLSAILLARTAFWQTARADRAYWRAWTRRHAAHCADVAFDYADPLPAVVHAFSEISLGIKSLPRFVRGVPRGPALSTGTARTAS